MSFPKRGEIWLGTPPDEDSERPCLIVSAMVGTNSGTTY